MLRTRLVALLELLICPVIGKSILACQNTSAPFHPTEAEPSSLHQPGGKSVIEIPFQVPPEDPWLGLLCPSSRVKIEEHGKQPVGLIEVLAEPEPNFRAHFQVALHRAHLSAKARSQQAQVFFPRRGNGHGAAGNVGFLVDGSSRSGKSAEQRQVRRGIGDFAEEQNRSPLRPILSKN